MSDAIAQNDDTYDDEEDPVFEDNELQLVVKSLSITYDALGSKLKRSPRGRIYDETLAEFNLCDGVLTKVRGAMSARLRR